MPGVFTSNVYPNVVNGSLGTVPYELECYIALVVLAVAGVMARSRLLLALIIIGGIALLMISSLRQIPDLALDNAVPGRVLVLCFFAGALLYIARAVIPYDARLFALAIVGSLICLSFCAALRFLSHSCGLCHGLDWTSQYQEVAVVVQRRLLLRNLSLCLPYPAEHGRVFPALFLLIGVLSFISVGSLFRSLFLAHHRAPDATIKEIV